MRRAWPILLKAEDLRLAALRDPAVLSVGRFTGIDTNGFSPTQPRTGTIRIRLKPQNTRPGYEEVSSRLRDAFAVAVPAAQLDFHQILEDMINDLSGSPAPVEVTTSLSICSLTASGQPSPIIAA